MVRCIGNISGRDFYAYETGIHSDLRCICVIPEEGAFIEIEEFGGELDKDVSDDEIKRVTGQIVDRPESMNMTDDARRLECFICGSESRVDSEFMPQFWRSLRVDFVSENDVEGDGQNIEGWSSEEVSEWIDDHLVGGLRELFHGSKKFCDKCVYELEADVEEVADKEFWSWVMSQHV